MHILTKGLADSRQQAQKLIRAGKVRDMNGQLLDKPGQEVSKTLELQVKSQPRFVSRGGEKLLAGLDYFSIKIQDRICLDCGISTGGFTDCLLQFGAKKVYGIDVGYGQTDWKLRNDSRVILKERTNIRHLVPEDLYGPDDYLASFAVADLSFISLRIVLPAIKSLLDKEAEALLLVKPQFEVGRGRVGKGGVVRDKNAHVDAIQGVLDVSMKLDWKPKGIIGSPITGAAGNHEYLLWLGIDENDSFPQIKNIVNQTVP